MNDQRHCEEFELLLQADIDGELDAAQAAAVTAHRHQCMRCMATYKAMLALREQIHDGGFRHAAPDAFRAKLAGVLAAVQQNGLSAAATSTLPARTANRKQSAWYGQRWLRDLGGIATGAIAATGLLLLLVAPPHQPDLGDDIVASHIHAMQANHLLDVVSTDQHNVKPWFQGKVDFAPPVKNLADLGFPLVGGRLDYVNKRTVAVTIFQRAKHPINLYAWPGPAVAGEPGFSTADGYNLASWSQGGMSLWAVSDLNMKELQEFVSDWRSR
jgi:anti-sigma factor RsiW